jgi:hypothetical protein
MLLDLCQNNNGKDQNYKCIGQILMVDFNKLKFAGNLDQHQLRNNVTIELEKSQEFIKNIWYTNFVNIFVEKSKFKSVHNSQLHSFYNSVATLASNQVSQLI